MKINHFFRRILMSIRSPRLYVAVTSESLLKAFAYLLGFLLIIGFISSTVQTYFIRQAFKDSLSYMSSDAFPDFYFQDGRFYIDLDSPIEFNNENTFIFIIDPTNAKTINDLAGYETGYLLQPETFFISFIGQAPTVYDLRQLTGIRFTKQEAVDYLSLTTIFIFPFVFFLTLLISIFSTLYKSTFVLLFGVLIGRSPLLREQGLNLGNIYKMTLYALTPGILLTKAVTLLLFLLPFSLPLLLIRLLPFFTFYLPSITLLSKGIAAYQVAHQQTTPNQ